MKMPRTKFVIGLVICGTVIGCSARYGPVPLSAQKIANPNLDYVTNSDPQRDARWAAAHGDLRFIAVRGIGLRVPYIDEEAPALSSEITLKAVAGTSDVINGIWEMRANEIAVWYAGIYNMTLFEELTSGRYEAKIEEVDGKYRMVRGK